MTTYWDLIPRDIWRMVLDYAAPQITHPKKWKKLHDLEHSEASPEEMTAMEKKLATLLAWIELTIKNPLSYLEEYYFGPGRHFLTSIKVLKNCLSAFQRTYNSLNRLEYAIQISRPSLYQLYYQAWLDFYHAQPYGCAFTKVAITFIPTRRLYTRESCVELFQVRMIASAALSNSEETQAWWRGQTLLINPLKLSSSLSLERLSKMTPASILWVASYLLEPDVRLELVRKCLSLSLESIVPTLLADLRLNLRQANLVWLRNSPLGGPLSKGLTSAHVNQLFTQVVPDLSLNRSKMLELIGLSWHGPVEWSIALNRALQLPLARLHRLIMYALAKGNSADLQILYSAFFASSEPNGHWSDLFYCSYLELQASSHWPEVQPFLRPLIEKALHEGRLHRTRRFPFSFAPS